MRSWFIMFCVFIVNSSFFRSLAMSLIMHFFTPEAEETSHIDNIYNMVLIMYSFGMSKKIIWGRGH